MLGKGHSEFPATSEQVIRCSAIPGLSDTALAQPRGSRIPQRFIFLPLFSLTECLVGQMEATLFWLPLPNASSLCLCGIKFLFCFVFR